MILPTIQAVGFVRTYTYTKQFKSSVVKLTLIKLLDDDHSEVSFSVNGDYNYEARADKVAITKWLLKVFAQIKTYNNNIYCSAYTNDGMGNYRTNLYRKLGFNYSEDELLVYKTK